MWFPLGTWILSGWAGINHRAAAILQRDGLRLFKWTDGVSGGNGIHMAARQSKRATKAEQAWEMGIGSGGVEVQKKVRAEITATRCA